MTQRKVRVRFAPSPTGALHIGGVRTALYNYLFAKQNGGDLILRIEDTDSQRFVPGAEAYIIEALTWLGIKFDEGVGFGGEYGPYRQSERRDIYKKYVDQLLDAGCAYIAFDTPEELAAIADTSSRSFKSLIGPKPVIAMLSHSTKGSAKHALVDKVVEATRIAHEEYPHLTLDGELQLESALVPRVAKSKAPGSSVNGHANVLIFPNLDAGNIGYKLVQRLGGAEDYGPMLQGIAKPVNDLSRGCSWQDIVGVVALTAVQAQLV